MKLKLLQQSNELPIQVARVKEYVRQTSDVDDLLIEGLIKTASAWVEEATGKTLLKKKWLYTNKNTRIRLPRGPVMTIEQVKLGSKVLQAADYQVIKHGHTTKIELPYALDPKTVAITYTAGFGENPSDIPETLCHAITSTVAYIYDNRYSIDPAKSHATYNMQPWIHYHRTACL